MRDSPGSQSISNSPKLTKIMRIFLFMAGVSTAGDNAAGASELGAHAFFAAVSTTLTKLFLSQ